MTTYLVKELFIRFSASAFRKLPSIFVFSYFPFGFEGRMWDLIVSVPDHCLSFYFMSPFMRGNDRCDILHAAYLRVERCCSQSQKTSKCRNNNTKSMYRETF